MFEAKDYDFRKPQRYSNENIKFLTSIAEEFCKTASLYLKYELNKNVKLSVERVMQTNYQFLMENIPQGSILVEHSIQPLVHNLIFQVNKEVGLAWVDMILGGDGNVEDTKRNLSEIDLKLIEHIISGMLQKTHIPKGCDYTQVDKIYSNTMIPQFFSPSESVCIADIEFVYEGKKIGYISFCTPYSSMEPIIDELIAKNLSTSSKALDTSDFQNKIYENINLSKLNIAAQLGKIPISVRDLLKLEEGDVLVTNKKAMEPIDVYVENVKTFLGSPGLVDKKIGVLIEDSINKEL